MERRSTRLAAKTDTAKTIAPSLTVTTKREGVVTQKLGVEQQIGFEMVVTLSTAANTPQTITELYDLQQYVKDAYVRTTYPAGTSDTQALGAWEPDGPFGPPYQVAPGEQEGNVYDDHNNIRFTDHPGFSTKVKIAPNEWLQSYEVQFYWVVTRKSDGLTWTSQQIRHAMQCAYNGGADVVINYTIAPACDWRLNNFT